MDERIKQWRDLVPKTFREGSKTEGEEKAGMEKKSADMLGGGAGTVTGGMDFGGILFTRPIEYRPEFASPDRWSIPYSFKERVKYFRMFFAVDPLIGTTIDLYCDMPLSGYDLVGSGVEGEVKETFMVMLDELNFLLLLKTIMVEYLVVGEVVCHLNYDKDAGIFSGWRIFKPEHCEVYDLGLIGLEDVVKYTPPEEEIKELSNISSLLQRLNVTDKDFNMKFVDKIIRDRSVVFDPINTAFIARRLHGYDLRGTSLISRLWRVLMYEDAVMNTTLQTAKRHSAPVKTVTMGDLASGYIPTQAQVDALLRSLAQAEADPQAWIFVPPGTRFDAWGTVDRIMGISKEYEVIERMKLIGLGVSRDFVLGTSTFASAQASLQVFMSRLLTFRTFMEEVFVKPKLFQTIAKVRKFKLPTQAELDHKVRTDKEDRGYIIPEIRWDKSLKPEVKTDLLEAYIKLVREFKVELSQRTIYNLVGLDWRDEVRKILQEKGVLRLLEKIRKKEQLTEQERGLLSEFGFSDIGFEPAGIEGIAPEPVVAPTAEGITMHASSVSPKITDEMVKEYAIKHGLLGKEDIEDNGTGNKKKDRFLTGNVRKLNPFVNYISDEEIRKRLENDDIYH
jgi:hypothetical protein